MSDSSTTDWGIPERFFGPVAEDFYAVVGRVTMMAALVDDMVLRLTWALTYDAQLVHAGRPISQLDGICRKTVARCSDELRVDVLAVLDQAKATRELRNAVVHSMWPNPTLDSAFGWRPARGGDANRVTKTFPTTRAVFEQLISSLVDEVGKLDELQQRAHVEKARR